MATAINTTSVVLANNAGLLTLPRELRDLILVYLLLKPTNIITMLGDFTLSQHSISACAPPICAVNKQMRAEALPLFYSGNTFTAQLDNDHDFDTAIYWLRAVGDDNVRHLRHIILCGWTRVPFGHMFTRKWIRVTLNLQDGVMDVGSQDVDYSAKSMHGHTPDRGHDEATATLEELNEVFHDTVEARAGKPFDVASLAQLMTAFNLLCSGY